jgi:hypothetical protein
MIPCAELGGRSLAGCVLNVPIRLLKGPSIRTLRSPSGPLAFMASTEDRPRDLEKSLRDYRYTIWRQVPIKCELVVWRLGTDARAIHASV